jgi:hypothetical protein
MLGNDSPLGVLFLIGTHKRPRKNTIECEIEGSVKNKRQTRIKLTAIEIIANDERQPW